MKKEGIGSYFHNMILDLKKVDLVSLPQEYKYFYSGRHALLNILDEIHSKNIINKIWFPNYYCQHTLNWIKVIYPKMDAHKCIELQKR